MAATAYALSPRSGNGPDHMNAGAGSCETDSAYLKRVIGQYGKGLYAVCSRIVDATDVEDVLQETWMRAYRKRGTFRGKNKEGIPCSEYTWLYGIARNCALMMRRKGYKKMEEPGIEKTEDQQNFQWTRRLPSPYEECERLETAGILIDSLKKMKPINRTALLLYEDLESVSAVAYILGRKYTTVRSLLHRARSDMRKCYLRLLRRDSHVSEPLHSPNLVYAEPQLNALTSEQKEAIKDALAASNGYVRSAARKTGIGFERLKGYCIEAGINVRIPREPLTDSENQELDAALVNLTIPEAIKKLPYSSTTITTHWKGVHGLPKPATKEVHERSFVAEA